MKKGEIHLNDWQRILFGEAPAVFLVEVLIRTIIVYFVLLVILRLMGKRMGGQLTITEMAIMVTIGAIISVPMQVPDRGLLHGILVMGCAFIFQRYLNLWGFKNTKVEETLYGKESVIVKEGVLELQEMAKVRISKQQLYASLRAKGIYNLGNVDRVYLEGCGIFSVFEKSNPAPGLPIYPPNDQSLAEDDISGKADCFACKNCGKTTDVTTQKCSNCNSIDFRRAIV